MHEYQCHKISYHQCPTQTLAKSLFGFVSHIIILSLLFLCFTPFICANKSSRIFISVVKTLIMLILLSNGWIKKPRSYNSMYHPLLIYPISWMAEASQRGGHTHLEADVPFLTAQAGQHEEDEREEPRERHSYHSQRRRP